MTRDSAFTLDRHTVLHLAPDQSVAPLCVDEHSWSQGDAIAELQDGRIMSVFAYESSWTWWERHPVGTELVFALSGTVVFDLQDDEDAPTRAIGLAAGECLLVPEGAWHRARITSPTTMLFVTPSPARTQHRDA